MKNFLLSIVICSALGLGAVLYFIFNHKFSDAEIPAPKLTSSISFNEKTKWLSSHLESCDVLIAGSSVALNNIDAVGLQNRLKKTSVVNAASWGLSLVDTGNLIGIVAPICKPKLIIIPLNYSDFQFLQKINNWKDIESYLLSPGSFSSYIKNPDLSYYLNAYFELGHMKTITQSYDSLMFDNSGSVLLSSDFFPVDEKRWNGFRELREIDSSVYLEQFSGLEKISNYAKLNNIKVLVVITPLREPARLYLNDLMRPLWSEFIKFINEKGITLLDGIRYEQLDDKYYVDYMHLNGSGAALFTQSLDTTIRKILNH